jgi:hypothetical protein
MDGDGRGANGADVLPVLVETLAVRTPRDAAELSERDVMDHRRHDMRNGPNNKRMRNRNNGGGGGGGGHNNRRSQNPMTRVFESNGPDIKIRGTASHVAEKYVQLARDARTSGDPVAAENYYQHAEHYFRLIAAAQEQFRQSQPQPRGEGEAPAPSEEGAEDESENFSHFGAEPGFVPREQPAFAPRENQYQPRENQPREHQQRDHQRRDHQPRDQQRHQPQPAPSQPQPGDAPVGGLPSFITGPQPTVSDAAFEGSGSGERFPPRRRRRPHGPRPEGIAPAPAGAGDDG